MTDVGYGKPPEHSRWQPGQSGNPGGMTPEHAAKRLANRDKAIEIETKMLSALASSLTDNEQAALDSIRADVLKLIHTAIERVDGKPTQHVDNTSSDDSLRPAVIRIVAATHDSVADSD